MLRRLLVLATTAADRVIASWIWVLALVFGAVIAILGLVAWEMAGTPVDDTEEAFAQLQALFTTVQLALAATVGMATIYQARATARTHRRMEERDEANKRRERIGIVHAFAGSAIETAAHATSLGELQRVGLKTWKAYFPESEMRRRLTLSGWERLSNALAATSKGFERLRYSEPDLVDSASALFRAVLEVHDLAMRGETAHLDPKVALVHAAAAALRDSATAPSPPPG